MSFYDEIGIGERHTLGSHRFTADEIKSFARRFDPQPFHLDEEAARHSRYGALSASGWHVSVVWMRLMVDYYKGEAEARRARGETVAVMGPSPGFREMKWPNPVFPGDTITYHSEVTAMRTSASRPEYGLVSMINTGTNQNGVRVMSFFSTAFVPRLPAR